MEWEDSEKIVVRGEEMVFVIDREGEGERDVRGEVWE